tara:strand:+ start:365 stop:715 length:351 start_codon:yes stop_codon:yes gene_type:complete
MKKSPLNVSMGDIVGYIGGGASKAAGEKKYKVSRRFIDKVQTLWHERPKSGGDDVPSFQTAVQGDVSDNVIQSAPETPLADPLTNPGASVAAENMFGATIPGSFDRSMGAPEEEIF